MTSAIASPLEKLLDALKTSLESHSPAIIERLAAHLFSKLLGGVGVYVSKTGAQFGADAGTAGLGSRRLRLECKRYQETTDLNPRALAGEVMQAVVNDRLLEAWVLVATKAVSENERNLALDAGSELGLPIVIIDWTPPAAGNGVCHLAGLCASWPEVVEEHLGNAAADAARALQPFVQSSISDLRRDLETWNIGYESLRQAASKKVLLVWQDSAASKAAINQDAAGGRSGVHLIQRTAPLEQLSLWWSQPPDFRTPSMVSGPEGVGKTWVVLDWLVQNVDSLPIVLLMGAGEFTNMPHVSVSGMQDFVVQALRGLTTSGLGDGYWQARVTRMLKRPVGEGPSILIIVDGLNQQPHVDWVAMCQSLQGSEFAGKVRLIATVRRTYLETDLRRLSGVEVRPRNVYVTEYSSTELDEMLRHHGMTRDDLHERLLDLAAKPRLFPLVYRLKDNAALRSEASVSRLLFEYGKDVMQLRQSSTLTDDEWVQWLVERAKDYRKRIGDGAPLTSTSADLASSLAAPHRSAVDVKRMLSDVVDGGMVSSTATLTGVKHSLNEDLAMLGLGLALLESMESLQGESFQKINEALLAWVEPVAAIDEISTVLVATLAVMSAQDGFDGTPIADVVLTTWMNLQNKTSKFERDATAFGQYFPKSLLCVIEHSTLRSQAMAMHFAIQSLRTLPRARVDDWMAVQERMLKWCGRIRLPDPKKLSDPNHYAKGHHEQLLIRLGTADPQSMTVLGERLHLGYEHEGSPDMAIPGILEGHELDEFTNIFRRAAVREAVRVEHQGDFWQGMKWLAMLGGKTEKGTREALVSVADDLLITSSETGVHERLRNRAAANALWATGDADSERRAKAINESFGRSWSYERDYLEKPAESLFALEHRHLKDVLDDESLSTQLRLRKLKGFIADPSLQLPPELEKTVDQLLNGQTFETMNSHGQATADSLNFEKLEIQGARFAPCALIDATRRRLTALAQRTSEAKYWASIASTELLLAATRQEASAFSVLRTSSHLGDQDHFANTWCLKLELLHDSLPEQLEKLLAAEEEIDFTIDLMSVVREATAEMLLRFLRAHSAEKSRAAYVVMQVMAYQVPVDAAELAKELVEYLTSPLENVRAIAFVALATCAPVVCGDALLKLGWKATVENPFEGHYGSDAVAAATRDKPLEEVLSLVAPWRWLDVTVARGGVASELIDASRQLIAAIRQSHDPVPDFGYDIAMGVREPGDVGRVSVRERRSGSPDDEKEYLKHLSDDTEAINRRWSALAREAASTIQKLRSTGRNLYLQPFSRESVMAAFKACPDEWIRLLEGMEERSPTFVNRLLSAEGLFLTLCEVLLEQDPLSGVKLWRALRENLRTQFRGEGDVSELDHIAFRASDSPAVESLRAEMASLTWCNTDGKLFELVIAAQVNRQDTWLKRLVDDDANSDSLWRKKRAMVVLGFMSEADLQGLKWPQGDKADSWHELSDRMALWTNRLAFARYWWKKFVATATSEEAYCAWLVFLSCADRRAYAWMTKVSQDANTGAEIDRLRRVHAESAGHVLKRSLKSWEDKQPALGNHLFGHEQPSTWLTLDGRTF